MTFRKAPPPKPDRSAEFASYKAPAATNCRITDPRARMTVPVPKDIPWRSETYRRRVAALPCAHCNKPGPNQCAHADTLGGKGMGIKVSDLLTYPACADSCGRRGCHSILSMDLPHQHRQTLEEKYVRQTQELLNEPKDD